MAGRRLKSVTNGTRNTVLADFFDITSDKPEKSLLIRRKKKAGRNNQGKITVRHRGGGHKQFYRLVDFKRDKDNIPAKVASIEYDPVRTARIALLNYIDGEKRYILAPVGLKLGDNVMSGGKSVEIKVGNSIILEFIPIGTVIHNIELNPRRGGQLIRSAGSSAQLMAKEGGYGVIKLTSGEIRLIRLGCKATIGQISNTEHRNIKWGKAGKSRHKGRRPVVRGSVMNPNDHPHGGGEGKAPIGRSGPVSPQGLPALGYKTRKNKCSDRYIIKRRGK